MHKDNAQIRVRSAVFGHSGRAVSCSLVGAGGYGQWGMWGMEVGHGGYRGHRMVGAWGAGCPGHSLTFHKSHGPESQILLCSTMCLAMQPYSNMILNTVWPHL